MATVEIAAEDAVAGFDVSLVVVGYVWRQRLAQSVSEVEDAVQKKIFSRASWVVQPNTARFLRPCPYILEWKNAMVVVALEVSELHASAAGVFLAKIVKHSVTYLDPPGSSSIMLEKERTIFVGFEPAMCVPGQDFAS